MIRYLEVVPFTLIFSAIAPITGLSGLLFNIYSNKKNQRKHEKEIYNSTLERTQAIVFEMQSNIHEVKDFSEKWSKVVEKDIGIKKLFLDNQLYFNKTETFDFWSKYLIDYENCNINKKLIFLKNKISLIMSNPNYDLIKNTETSEGPNSKIKLDQIFKDIRRSIGIIESRIIFINYFMDCWPEIFNDKSLKYNFWNNNTFPIYVQKRLVPGRIPAVNRDRKVKSVRAYDTLSPFNHIYFMYHQRLLMAVSGLEFIDLN